MITLTETAKTQLDSYFTDNPKTPIRIFLASGGCSGPRLSLALDEKNDADDSFDIDGYTFLVERELLRKAKPLTVDLGYMGFQIESSLELGGGGSPGACSSGSCCG